MAVTVRGAAWLVAAAMVAAVGPGVGTAVADDSATTDPATSSVDSNSGGPSDPGTTTVTPISITGDGSDPGTPSTDSGGPTDPGTSTTTPISVTPISIGITPIGITTIGDPGSSTDPGADTGGSTDGLTGVVVPTFVAYSAGSGAPLLLAAGPAGAPTSTPGQNAANSRAAGSSRRVANTPWSRTPAQPPASPEPAAAHHHPWSRTASAPRDASTSGAPAKRNHQ